MAKKQAPGPLPPPSLRVPREEAAEYIRVQIDKGTQLRQKVITSPDDLGTARSELSKWRDYNRELLGRLFDNPSIKDEYVYAVFYGTFGSDVEDFRRQMNRNITKLESVLARLDLIPEPEHGSASGATAAHKVSAGTDVFVVHGRDQEAKESVARFIEKLELHALILHEQPDAGRTIIEKFEDYSNVGFAVVLLTPDDIGAPQDKPDELKARARQNVIFELGYFHGRLGRNRVCCLYKEGVEVPSDYGGVLYVPMDPSGGWRLRLAQEIKQAGIPVDLNKAVNV